MADNFDDFGFGDDLDGFDNIGDSFDLNQDQSQSQDQNQGQPDEFGDFGLGAGESLRAEETTQDKTALIKTSAIIIAVAVMIIVIVFKIVGGSGKNKTKPNTNTGNQVTNATVQNNNTQSNANSSSNNDGWIGIDGKENITFSQNTIPSTFTITGIKHYAKVVDNEKNLMVKTVLTGTLDGLSGTFNLEVPYSKGSRLSIGGRFSVNVELGEYGEKVVVGEISY